MLGFRAVVWKGVAHKIPGLMCATVRPINFRMNNERAIEHCQLLCFRAFSLNFKVWNGISLLTDSNILVAALRYHNKIHTFWNIKELLRIGSILSFFMKKKT